MAADAETISTRQPLKALFTLTTLHVLFFVASLVAIPVLAPGSRIPNPFGNDANTRTFFLTAAVAIRVSDFLQLASALCLGATSALFGSVLEQNRRETASWLTAVGGAGASVMLALSALFSWAIVSPGAADLGPALHAFQFIPFLLGGPGWAGFFAIFLAGLTLAARELLPRWLRIIGYSLSFISAAATPVLLNIVFSPCLPIARFLGFLWLIGVSICLVRPSATTPA